MAQPRKSRRAAPHAPHNDGSRPRSQAWAAALGSRPPCRATLLPRDRDAPRQLAHLDRLDDLETCDIDDGNVVRYAVGGQKVFLVRGEGHVPDALSDEKIFLDRMRCRVYHRDAIGRAQRHECGAAIIADSDADRLNSLLAQSWDLESDLCRYLVLHRVDDADRAADLGGDPEL